LILEEIGILKKDMQYLFDNYDAISKVINQLKKGMEKKKETVDDSFGSNASTQSTKIKKIYLPSNFDESDVKKLGSLARNVNYSDNQDVLLFVDSDYRIYELVYRKDLNYNTLINSPESVVSYFKKINEEELIKIDSRKSDHESLKESELDISRNSNFFDISQMMKDTIPEITDSF
jgi:hypothetical protein